MTPLQAHSYPTFRSQYTTKEKLEIYCTWKTIWWHIDIDKFEKNAQNDVDIDSVDYLL